MNNYSVGQLAPQKDFSQSAIADISRSTFNRPCNVKTTFKAGYITPIKVEEVIPGDTFEVDLAYISRLVTPIFPTMDNLELEFHAFFTPMRILWDGWQELHGENKTSAWTPSTPPALVPMITTNAALESRKIGDYFGLEVGMNPSVEPISALPFRGYRLIWNEWYRDQNLQAPLPLSTGNSETLLTHNDDLLKANKKHDYFTSCLPAPQKGESALIPIELNELIPVITGVNHTYTTTTPMKLAKLDGTFNASSRLIGAIGTNGALANSSVTDFSTGGESLKPANLYADGRGMAINATTISELRTAFQLQKLYEKDARGGTRYIEMLKAHFGVESQDYRLQRPEYLGGHSTYLNMCQVPQTSSTDTTSPQGNMSAYSYNANTGTNFYSKSFVEHGYVFIFVVARQRKTYQQGIEKMWTRKERFDFYYPTLANISEQPVYNKEIKYSASSDTNNEVFGYQEPWADYRHSISKVTGQFRSGVTGSLDVWHYADFYDDVPVLSSEWIEDNSDINIARTLAVDTELSDQIYLDCLIQNKATRPMPIYSIPGMVDHY